MAHGEIFGVYTELLYSMFHGTTKGKKCVDAMSHDSG